ncbi:acyl-ACP--UDP-N-acetylglucosamine O-acyltransferase [Parvibium lacunae]|uniref:Acyl-[acyl-carrier-protein]--UDP-N-acetylglucosamine O-acyltransferase n=1 Tax=Parvibium lacunae TaxID=1888893 RepID=A0A368L7I5_9BURK|nr:acyl-ACP--UDP-N-acetylglucosamine O-acyltransferase [Parvibium lacunae]RCS59577.1 acyl-ACP--UDP-N-acetylglucosamine O-acyltransferase [Parvibium lacunae]
MTTPLIHPTAIIDSKAALDSSVAVGPYTVVGPNVKIGPRTRLEAHVTVEGHTTIGAENHIFSGAALGGAPQDKKYAGEPTRLELGDRNTIRECCTINTGTIQDEGITRIGSDNWIMAYVHIAHDCQVGDRAIMANCTQLAGHVHVGDWVILGGFTGVHQFVRIGAHAMTGIHTTLTQDLPPFVLYAGQPAAPHGINAEGLKRRGFSKEAIRGLIRAYKTLYREDLTLDVAQTRIREQAMTDEQCAPSLSLLLDFLATSTRGIAR